MSLNKRVAGDFGYETELVFMDTDTGKAEDLSAFTSTQTIQVRTPDGSVKTLSGSFSGTGTDGKVKAIVTEGTYPANWSGRKVAERIQVTRTGGTHSSEWEEFTLL